MAPRWLGWRRELKREATLFVVGLILAAVAGLIAYYGLLAAAHKATR